MGVNISCRGKNAEDAVEDEPKDSPTDPDNTLTPIQTTNDFIRPLENPYPPLPPVDDVEYGPGAAVSDVPGIPRPKTYAVVVSRLAGHKWLKLKLEPKEAVADNHAEGMDD